MSNHVFKCHCILLKIDLVHYTEFLWILLILQGFWADMCSSL
ncbi:hypothetical protein [Moraxella lacunata]